MAQNPLGPPPFIKQEASFDRWMRLMWQRIVATGQVLWTQIVMPTEVKNTFLAGPTTGADAQADFRAIVAADLGTGTPDGTKFLRDDLTWQVPTGSGGGGAVNNVISTPTEIAEDTSYIVIEYLKISDALTNNGNIRIL